MILKLNHVKSEAAGITQEVTQALYELLETGQVSQEEFARLHVHLDWVQYKQNFREPVMGALVGGESPVVNLYVDTRQVPACHPSLKSNIVTALGRAHSTATLAAPEQDRFLLEDFKSFRQSIAWEFNSLYWRRLDEWERSSGHSYEKALPGGSSDGNHPEAIADSVADFWTLLQDLDKKKQLPAEVFLLEIGVGSGKRCGMFLDKFQALDQLRGTNYYSRLRVLMGDFSLATLDMSRPNVKQHLPLCSFIVLDALDPLKTLSFLRHKVLYIHTTNMYDNLPSEEILRRDGHFYLVQVRLGMPMAQALRIASAYGIPFDKMRATIERMLQGGADFLGDPARGISFWKEIWDAARLEERLVRFESLPDSPLPDGLDIVSLEELLKRSPDELRFHVSTGAFTSFRNTLPLLHPRGYLQVMDIFVTSLNAYAMGFYGPGKLDGSIVNWVNGALLKGVAERVGYDVHFAPYRYRSGSKTSILYTSPRE